MAMRIHPVLRKYQTKSSEKMLRFGAFDSLKDYHGFLKRLYKSYMDYEYHDPLAHSMQDGLLWERYHSEGDGYWCHYGFVEFDPEDVAQATDMELAEWFDENMRVRIWSDYDCTGKPFTTGINFHRNPNGMVSFVHHMALDI